MYLKDQTKRVQYTFRIKEDLMEDLKAYSKAKGVKIPRILNEIIEQYLDGVVVRNTWLIDQPGTFITIPSDIQKRPLHLTDDMDGMEYEIKSIPNNLDVWNDKCGYTSGNKDLEHEGLEPLLIPSLIEDIDITKGNETMQELTKCLCAIYFRLVTGGTLEIFLLTIQNAIGLAAPNNKMLADILVDCRTKTNQCINDAIAGLNDDNALFVKKSLLENLEALGQDINTGNIVPIGTKHTDSIHYDTITFDAPANQVNDLQKQVDALTEQLANIEKILDEQGIAAIVDKVKKDE